MADATTLNFQDKLDSLDPGDVLNVEGGRFYNQYELDGIKGTSNNWIKIIGTPGNTVLHDNNKFSHMGFHTNHTEYLEIHNIEFYGHHHPIYLQKSGTHHLKFINCDFHHYLGPPSVARNAHDIELKKCKFHDIGKGTNNLFNMMNMGEQTKDITFDSCEFFDQKYHNCLNFGHHDNLPHLRTTVKNCHFYDNTGGDMILCNASWLDGAIIIDNFIERGNWGGIRVDMKNSYVARNTIREMGHFNSSGQPKGTGVIWCSWDHNNTNNVVEYNNISDNIAASAGYYGIDIHNAKDNIIRGNYVKGQRGLCKLRGSDNIIIDPYNNDKFDSQGNNVVKYSDNRDFVLNNSNVAGSALVGPGNYIVHTSSLPPIPPDPPDPQPDPPDPQPDPPDPQPDPNLCTVDEENIKLLIRYDIERDRIISKENVIAATNDYFENKITKEEIVFIQNFYFGNCRYQVPGIDEKVKLGFFLGIGYFIMKEIL